MASNIRGEAPGVDFIGPCNMCPHMKRITLEAIRDSLIHMRHEILVPEDMAERARLVE